MTVNESIIAEYGSTAISNNFILGSGITQYVSTYTVYNDGHNILRLFDTISNFLFTTSEAKRDY